MLLFSMLVLMVNSPASSAQAAIAIQAKCFVNLGSKSYFGSTEQVKELQKLAAVSGRNACPRIGFAFRAPPRRSVVVFDRQSASIVRLAQWTGEPPRWEYWSGVTDERLKRDNPDDGFDAGDYHDGPSTEGLVPRATRQYVARLFGVTKD